jgi:hypothetical protein
LYQYLSNEKKVPQLWVSGIFSLLQFGINLLLVFGYLGYIGIIIIFLGLSLIYWLIKAPFLAVPAN